MVVFLASFSNAARVRIASHLKQESAQESARSELQEAEDTQEETQELELSPGMQVCVTGLEKGTQYNGLLGTVEGEVDGGRWNVRLSSGLTKSFKPANLDIEDFGEDLRVGTQIRVTGLTGATQYNDLTGVCMDYNCSSHRWRVQLNSSDFKEIKPKNLVVEGQAPPLQGPIAAASLINKKGEKIPLSALEGKIVVLYFSAHWCGPCRQFTPALRQFYDAVKSKGGNIEVVFVSADDSIKDSTSYFRKDHGNWLAVEFGSPAQNQLQMHYRVQGIPNVAVINSKGANVVPSAINDVMRATSAASAGYMFSSWKQAVLR